MRRFRTLLLVLATLCATGAKASLGAGMASVEADRVHMAAHHVATAGVGYTIHVLTTDAGTMKEFTRGDGKVFAVVWRGQGRPDLRQALGPYFDALNAANPPRNGLRRRPLAADMADLVVRSGGHPGAFWGVAYVRQLMPVGFAPAELK